MLHEWMKNIIDAGKYLSTSYKNCLRLSLIWQDKAQFANDRLGWKQQAHRFINYWNKMCFLFDSSGFVFFDMF
jgi:hypothetical protein